MEDMSSRHSLSHLPWHILAHPGHGTELMFGFPRLHQVRSLSDSLPQILCAVSEEKKHSRVIPATQDSETGHQHPAPVTILHYTRDLLPTAPSVPTEGRLHRGMVKLSNGMTPSTQGIKGDFLFTPAIFTSQKCVLGEQPSPEALLRAEIPTPSSLQPAGCSPAGDDSPALLAAQG